jgi:hypothetical protein
MHSYVGFNIPKRIIAEGAGNGKPLAEPWAMTTSCYSNEKEKKITLH